MEASAEAEQLVELRRNSRGVEVDDEYRVGEDVAVPRSRLVDYVAELEALAASPRCQAQGGGACRRRQPAPHVLDGPGRTTRWTPAPWAG